MVGANNPVPHINRVHLLRVHAVVFGSVRACVFLCACLSMFCVRDLFNKLLHNHIITIPMFYFRVDAKCARRPYRGHRESSLTAYASTHRRRASQLGMFTHIKRAHARERLGHRY